MLAANEYGCSMAYVRHRFGKSYITPGEVKIISALIRGLTIQKIAGLLGVARSTIKTQIERIYARTMCFSRGPLIAEARDCGFDKDGNFTPKLA